MPDISLRRVDSGGGEPRLNVIFVHGLGGDPVSTWCHKGGENGGYFWLKDVAGEIEGAAVYTLGYPGDKAAWSDGWPIAEAAVAVLDKLMNSSVLRASRSAPIAFVCHSLGGLIIKKLVVTAHLDRGQQPGKGEFLDRIAGVVFLATPHDGSIIASIAKTAYWFVSKSLDDLTASDTALLELGHFYRDRVANEEVVIRHRVYYEKLGIWGTKVVTAASADPGLPGVHPIPVNRDHKNICKPAKNKDLVYEDPIYEGIVAFLQDDLLQPRKPTQNEKLDEILGIVSRSESVPLEPLRAVLNSMGEMTETADAGEIVRTLSAKASEFKTLTDKLNRLSNVDPEVARLRKESAEALKKGRFKEADEHLATAEARDLAGLEDVEALAKQKRLSAAESRGERAAAAMLRANSDAYREAASHYAEAARIAAGADVKVARAYTNASEGARGSSFNAAMRILPRPSREAMFEIYAFCRAVDNIADEVRPRGVRKQALDQWRSDIGALYAPEITRHRAPEGLRGLSAAIHAFGLRREDFCAVIDGMEMDVETDIRAPSLATLDLYCDRVASAVGRLSARAFGMPEAEGHALAHHLGRALQLTNILRDLDEDAALGRLYLPREDLRKAGIEEEEPLKILANPELERACMPTIARAREHFGAARKIMARCPRASVRAPQIMADVYFDILASLEKRGFVAPRQRIRTPRHRVVLALLRHGLF